MKNLKITKYVTLAALMLAFIGCNDILEDTDPPTSVSSEVALSSPDGVNALYNSMYSNLRSSFGYSTEYFIGPSAFADETRARVGATRMQALNDAEGTFGTNHLRPYNATYSIILEANLLIEAVEDGVLPDGHLNRIKGEAHALRAFAMHHLVRSLGYEPNDPLGRDSHELGIIIRTEPTIELEDADERERSTIYEVYDQIHEDLESARTFLSGDVTPDGSANRPENRVTEAFVDGLTARVNLYQANWEEAAEAAQNAIDNSGLTLVDTQGGVGNMFDEGGGNHPEALFVLEVDPQTEPIAGSNTNDGPAGYTSTQWVAQVPTQMLLDLYEDDDYRTGEFVLDGDGEVIVDETGLRQYEGGWYQPCYDDTDGEPQSGCDAVNEDELSTNKFNGGNGNLSDNLPYMRLSEVYLILAEAEARQDNSQAAIDAMNTLREARNASTFTLLDFTDYSSYGGDFEDVLLEERMRELVVEGHRFWDLKRTGRDIRNPDGGLKMAADSYRIIANIGGALIGANPLLEENPGY